MNCILMDVRTTYLIVPNGGIITWITILVVVIDVVKLKRFEIISSFYTLHHKTPILTAVSTQSLTIYLRDARLHPRISYCEDSTYF